METDNLLVVNESRENINIINEYCIKEYKKCLQEENGLKKSLDRQKSMVDLGYYGANIELLFASRTEKFFGRILAKIARPIIKWKMTFDNKRKLNNVQKKKEEIEEMYIQNSANEISLSR